MTEQVTSIISTLKFDKDGLIPAIAQQYDSGEVLMLAWMNKESIEQTIKEKQAVYWSRSRNRLWKKGEESGHIQHVKEFIIDCDGDTLLLLVDQTGLACHTGRKTCFFNTSIENGIKITRKQEVLPEEIYKNKK